MAAFFFFFLFVFAGASAQGLRVNTTEGLVEGNKARDGDYYAFYGIPYAGPTNGTQRFKAPVPPTPHSGVFYANNTNVICAQPSPQGLIGVENCLTLNIFTKNTTGLKPVIVWLNAEAYTNSGNNSFSPKKLVDENVVFVSLNFRLSIFGFLCLGVKDAPGNAGLRDVLQGLKWIKANIANFTGDPNNIVLMGHSSGAAIVDLITMAPQAKGLVHKAVALSGSALAPWAVSYNPVENAVLLGVTLRYIGKTKKDLARFFMKVDNSTLLNAALVEFLHLKNNKAMFAPCVENAALNPNDTVLIDAPINLLKAGKFLQIPYIAAYTTEEGTMRASEAISNHWLSLMNTNFSLFLPVDIRNIQIDGQKEDLAYLVKLFYFDFKPVNMSTIDQYLDYEGDTLVVVPVIRGAKARTLNSTAEVRLLEFGHVGTTEPDVMIGQKRVKGVRHGGILNYIFDYNLKPKDEAVMKSIVNRLITFAYTGVPNATNTTTIATNTTMNATNTTTNATNTTSNATVSTRNTTVSSMDISWPVVTKDKINVLTYTDSRSRNHAEIIITDPYPRMMAFWEGVRDLHYEPPKSVVYSYIFLNLPDSSGMVMSSFLFVICCQLLIRLL